MSGLWVYVADEVEDIDDSDIIGMDDEHFGVIARKSFEDCGDDEDELVVNGWNDDGSDAWEEDDDLDNLL